MKKYTLISLFFLVVLALIPPIDVVLRNPQYKYWLWLVLTAGFAGVYTLFLKGNLFVKIIAVGSFIDCFFSAVPYISFTTYCSIVLCCYFYLSCTKIEDWRLIFRAAQALLLLNTILLVLEFFGKDTLMNWSEAYTINFGVLGHHMQMGSFAVIIASFLLSFSKLNFLFPILISIFAKSSWTFLCAGAGIFAILFQKNKKAAGIILLIFILAFTVWDIKIDKFRENIKMPAGRLTVWEKTIHLANEHPWVGWGPGTYKQIFAPLSRMTCIPYKTAHNFIIESFFEFGYPITICLLFGLGWLLRALIKSNLWLLVSGLIMMIMDALVHFPDRQIQCVPLMILFLAYCNVSLKRIKSCQTHCLAS